MMMLADPLTARELEEESTIEAAVGAEIDVLNDGRLAQPGLAQAAGEPLVLAAGRFAVDEQPEPILAAEFAGVGSEIGFGRARRSPRSLTAPHAAPLHASARPRNDQLHPTPLQKS